MGLPSHQLTRFPGGRGGEDPGLHAGKEQLGKSPIHTGRLRSLSAVESVRSRPAVGSDRLSQTLVSVSSANGGQEMTLDDTLVEIELK